METRTATKSNWQKIPDAQVRQVWSCGAKHCGKHGEQITVDPSFFANSGLPICSECGNDLNYHGTEILRDCKNITRTAKPVIINVRSGVAELLSKPTGITVLIRDYDVQGVDEERLQRDSEGNSYIEVSHTCTTRNQFWNV